MVSVSISAKHLLHTAGCFCTHRRACTVNILHALDHQICEDSPHQLERPLPALNGTSSNALVPRLMALFQSHDAEARCLAVACINLMAGNMPNALADGLDQYVSHAACLTSCLLGGACGVVFTTFPWQQYRCRC